MSRAFAPDESAISGLREKERGTPHARFSTPRCSLRHALPLLHPPRRVLHSATSLDMAIAPIQGALRRSVRPPCSLPLRRTRSFSHDAHSRRPSSTSRSASGPASSAATRSGACALALLLLSLRRPASRTLTPPLRSTGTSTTCAMVRCSLALFMSVRSPSAPQLTRSAPPPPLLLSFATSSPLSSPHPRRVVRSAARGAGVSVRGSVDQGAARAGAAGRGERSERGPCSASLGSVPSPRAKACCAREGERGLVAEEGREQ